MIQYANDHDGHFPTGASSTEVFQKLVDDGYITNTDALYLSMDGKTKAFSNKLKPENICWDVTADVRPDDPGNLPVIFTPGYKINYNPHGQSFQVSETPFKVEGIAVGFRDGTSRFILAQSEGFFGKDFVVFTPTFNPKGRTYRQLTPTGPLP